MCIYLFIYFPISWFLWLSVTSFNLFTNFSMLFDITLKNLINSNYFSLMKLKDEHNDHKNLSQRGMIRNINKSKQAGKKTFDKKVSAQGLRCVRPDGLRRTCWDCHCLLTPEEECLLVSDLL